MDLERLISKAFDIEEARRVIGQMQICRSEGPCKSFVGLDDQTNMAS